MIELSPSQLNSHPRRPWGIYLVCVWLYMIISTQISGQLIHLPKGGLTSLILVLSMAGIVLLIVGLIQMRRNVHRLAIGLLIAWTALIVYNVARFALTARWGGVAMALLAAAAINLLCIWYLSRASFRTRRDQFRTDRLLAKRMLPRR